MQPNVSSSTLMLTRSLQFTCLICEVLSLVQPSRPLAQPLAQPTRPFTLSRMFPWALSVSACWLYEVQWTVQIAWGVENSFVTRTLLSAKARWSFTMDTLSMWNCFFSQETHGFTPTFMAHTKKWPSIKMKTGPDHSYFSPSYLSTIFVFLFGFGLFPPLFGSWENVVPTLSVLEMQRKFTLGIIH